MLKKISEKNLSDITTLIASNTEISGRIDFMGELEIEGRVNGDIYARTETKAMVRILENGCVEGQIHAPHVIVNGYIKGDIYAYDKLEISNKATIEGNIHYNVVEMSPGAKINGTLLYDKDMKDNKNSKEKSVEREEVFVSGQEFDVVVN